MAADVRTLVDHFFGAAKTYVASSADALKSGDMSAFKATVSQVAGLPVVRQIANAISTSKAEMERFETFVKDAGPFGEIILGLTTTTAGGQRRRMSPWRWASRRLPAFWSCWRTYSSP
jgi:hypothetical protein